jgi:hypothetical protein
LNAAKAMVRSMSGRHYQLLIIHQRLSTFELETIVLRKLVPVLGSLLLAGPVLAADAPSSSASAPAASADSSKDSKAAPAAHKKHHKKKPAAKTQS